MADPEEQLACDFGYQQGLKVGGACYDWEWSAVCDWPLFYMNAVTWAYVRTIRIIRKYTLPPLILMECYAP